MRRQACQRAAVDVANVIDACLKRALVHPPKLFENFRHGVECETSQLNLLPRGDIQNAVAKPPREFRDGAELRAPRETVRHANAHHEFAGCRFTEEHANPLQQFFFRGGERRGAALDDLWKVIQDVQAIAVH